MLKELLLKTLAAALIVGLFAIIGPFVQNYIQQSRNLNSARYGLYEALENNFNKLRNTMREVTLSCEPETKDEVPSMKELRKRAIQQYLKLVDDAYDIDFYFNEEIRSKFEDFSSWFWSVDWEKICVPEISIAVQLRKKEAKIVTLMRPFVFGK